VALRADDNDLARDRALVEACQAGDVTAFDELYLRHFDRLRAFCQRRVGDRSEAEEIAQEAFAKAYQALPRFSGERRFYPWVSVIAGRLCVDHHRRRARVQPSDDIDLGTVDDGHDERLALRADLAALDRALGRLGPRHREVLELRERDGLSYHEIAATLDVPHSTVEALLFRARRALRKEFHRVSAERLAGLPIVGWAVGRLARLRDRFAESGVDLAALGAPMAAGAVTVFLALPAGAPAAAASSVVPPPRATPIAAARLVPPADVVVPDATAAATPSTTPSLPGITPMTDGDANRQAEEMPVHLDFGELGAGIDTDPLTSRLAPAPASASERTLP
jgi:RNA polymerase sigma-70 factor (ECF subfamily)